MLKILHHQLAVSGNQAVQRGVTSWNNFAPVFLRGSGHLGGENDTQCAAFQCGVMQEAVSAAPNAGVNKDFTPVTTGDFDKP